MQDLLEENSSFLRWFWFKDAINNVTMIFYKNLKLKNRNTCGDNRFSANKAMIPNDAYPLGEQPGNIGTPRNTNDWIAMNVVNMIGIEA